LGSGRAETYIVVSDRGEFREQMLSCEITACNGHVPRAHLQVGSIDVTTRGCPAFISFRNITRPTRMLLPMERAGYQWALISHLAMNYSSLAQTDTLRRLLGLYEWTREEQNQRRMRGVEVLSCKPADMVHRGALMRGVEVQLRFDDQHYGSIADSYLFGMLLHRFFATYASVNSFVRTKAQTHPSNLELTWQPMIGETSPI
jgi:type VI secretion system protein ImpG